MSLKKKQDVLKTSVFRRCKNRWLLRSRLKNGVCKTNGYKPIKCSKLSQGYSTHFIAIYGGKKRALKLQFRLITFNSDEDEDQDVRRLVPRSIRVKIASAEASRSSMSFEPTIAGRPDRRFPRIGPPKTCAGRKQKLSSYPASSVSKVIGMWQSLTRPSYSACSILSSTSDPHNGMSCTIIELNSDPAVPRPT
jgi:hypothetical protein